jgi:dTDP-4-amino-4,6-dideoxygalactose transaminase
LLRQAHFFENFLEKLPKNEKLLVMKVPLIDLRIQNAAIRNEAMETLGDVFDSSSFILGPNVEKFEANMAKYLGSKHAIAVSSGTDALLLSMMALGIGYGDEVICPSFTFLATAGCVARLGAIPVFADIDLVTFNVNVDDIWKKISVRTKAIIPVHLFGQTADIAQIVAISEECNLPIVEDCAQSLGAMFNRKQSGTFGLAGCFSFYPTKNLGGFGDMGLLCTDSDKFAERARLLRTHGMNPRYLYSRIGGNFRPDEFQAAMLNLKLPHLGDYIANRRKNAEIYSNGLQNLDNVTLPMEDLDNFHTWNQFTIRIRDGRRNMIATALEAHGIGCGIYYPLPLDAQECMRGYVCETDLTKNAQIAANEVLSLPIYPELTSDQISYVIETLRRMFQ